MKIILYYPSGMISEEEVFSDDLLAAILGGRVCEDSFLSQKRRDGKKVLVLEDNDEFPIAKNPSFPSVRGVVAIAPPSWNAQKSVGLDGGKS
jgi:hypothetical protein